jgi:hypothetical protein
MFKIHVAAEKWAASLLKKNKPIMDNDEVAGQILKTFTPDTPIKTQFDLYYLFLLVGLGKVGTTDISSADAAGNMKDLVRDVTSEFYEYKHIIAGLVLLSELMHAGFSIEKKLVQNKVVELLQSDSSTFLSDKAVSLMNAYAFAGFEHIRESYGQPPANANDFLLWYYNEMLPQCFNSSEWSQ